MRVNNVRPHNIRVKELLAGVLSSEAICLSSGIYSPENIPQPDSVNTTTITETSIPSHLYSLMKAQEQDTDSCGEAGKVSFDINNLNSVVTTLLEKLKILEKKYDEVKQANDKHLQMLAQKEAPVARKEENDMLDCCKRKILNVQAVINDSLAEELWSINSKFYYKNLKYAEEALNIKLFYRSIVVKLRSKIDNYIFRVNRKNENNQIFIEKCNVNDLKSLLSKDNQDDFCVLTDDLRRYYTMITKLESLENIIKLLDSYILSVSSYDGQKLCKILTQVATSKAVDKTIKNMASKIEAKMDSKITDAGDSSTSIKTPQNVSPTSINKEQIFEDGIPDHLKEFVPEGAKLL